MMTEMSHEEVMALEPELSRDDRRRQTVNSRLYLGAGSFHGVDKFIHEDFQKLFPGSIKSTTKGFMNPNGNKSKTTAPPTPAKIYKTGGFIQVVRVDLRQPEQNFENLIRFFFQFHDPTLDKEQGADRGYRFSSFIFCTDIEQAKVAAQVKAELQSLVNSRLVVCFHNENVLTRVCLATTFFSAPTMDLPVKTVLLEHVWNTSQHRLYMEKWPTEYLWYDDRNIVSSLTQKITTSCRSHFSWTALTIAIAQ